jgi:hypothetical protein
MVRHGKPVGTSGCIHRYFAQESVVCDGGGTECIAVHMELEILFFISSIVLCIGPYSCLLFRM